MPETEASVLGTVPSTSNLTSTPKQFFDVSGNMQTVLLWTPEVQALTTTPAALTAGRFGAIPQHDRNAISISFVLRRSLPVSQINVSPLDTGTISQQQMLASLIATTFVFPLNPTKQTVTKDKIHQWILSNGGFIKQTWGNEIIKMTFMGKTSSLQPELEAVPGIPLALQPLAPGVYDTAAYKNFKLLEFYQDYFDGGNEDNRLLRTATPSRVTLTLGSWGGSFDGMMSNLSYTLDADNPFRIEYSFNFEAVPRLHIPNTALAPV